MSRLRHDYLERRRSKRNNDVPGQMSAARFMQLAKEVQRGNDPDGVITTRLNEELKAQQDDQDAELMGVDMKGYPVAVGQAVHADNTQPPRSIRDLVGRDLQGRPIYRDQPVPPMPLTEPKPVWPPTPERDWLDQELRRVAVA